ncbi:uncharacterized protein LOC134246276, partial [Saccostrea cucullata]|uniref:uncharacterized protein LOC134246276 n=1 Tax=Saccostrea cuccullata TaxID=36930 RepID=UPI002ED688CD
MPRKKSWKKAAVKKTKSCKADVGDKYPTDVGHVQPSVPLGVGHVLTPMTSVPAGVISTTPVTVVSAALPETTLTETMPQVLPLAQTIPQMLPLAQTMPQMLPLAQMLPQKLPQMITLNSSQLLTQNISQITTQNITPFTMNNIPNETTHALQGNCMHQNSDNLVFGSFHQGSMRFSSFSRGNQCTCNSLMMLSNSYENFSFTSSFLDQTLLKGDNLYSTAVKNLQSAGNFKSRLLMFDELPLHIDSGENHHIVDKFDTLFGLLVTDDNRNQIQTLHECLQQALGLSRYVLIMIGSICSALYKASDNDFYFFDSHSHGENGLSECDGKSLMRHSCCLDDLLGFLYAMYESMHIEFATEFEVMPVAFRTLIHSFPSNNQSTHQYCRLDQLTTTALTNKQSAGTNTGHLKTTAIKKDKKDYMREYMRNKRQESEFKQKERDSKRNKRQDPEFKERERDRKRNKRQDPEFKDNERDRKRNKRQDAEFKGKERDSKRNKRQDPEFKEKERDSMRNKRQDPEFIEKERDSMRNKRQDPEFIEKERDSMRNKRQDPEFKDRERNKKERDSMRNKRQDPEFKDRERNSKRNKRQDPEFKEKERDSMRNKRQEPEFKEKERDNNVLLHAEIKRKYFTNTKSVNGQEWICNTCNSSLKESRTPKLSIANGMTWLQKPSELNLLPLEERLVSLRIPFMQIRELPRGGQYSVKGNVVNVPVDIQPTINSLPRRLDENITIPVKLKRKLSFQHSYCHENIRPTKVLIALHWLMKNSEYYQNSNINIDDNWFLEVTNSASELMREFIEGHTNQDSAMHDQSDESDSDEFCEVDSGKDGNRDTLLDSDSYDMNQIFTFAPGEGQRPISLYQDQMAEYLSFPTIFCGKGKVENDQRQIPVSYADIAKWELRSVDRRAAQSVPNLFFKLKKIQLKQVTDKCNLALRKCKTKGKTFTANEIRNPDQINDIVRHNEGFYVFKQLRNSPPYLETRKKDVFAMIRQLGLPTWFMSFSAADTRWNDLIRALGVLNDDKQYTDSEIESMTWTEKSKLIQKDPITCTRYFDHRFRTFLNTVLKSDHHPIGKIQDFFYRVEFQQRGSPHVHMIVWIENAPKYLENDNKEIAAFVDSYLKCERNTEDNLTELQVHKHSQTCKKKGKAVCRFGFPLPPLQATMILEPLDSDIDKYKKMHKTMQDKVNDFKNGCDISCTFQDFLQNVLQLSEDDYIKCIRSSLRTPKVFLKRKPCDLRVNAYNSTLLHAWAANIDIQYVLDPYACAMYIVSYISKSQRGMSELLSRAAKEAREGNLDIKRQVRHIGNQFLNSVEVGAQEAAYLVLQMPLTKASRDVMFINTSPVDDRVILVKPDSELEKLNANSTDIECSNIVKRYAKRPKQLENWCLADYVSQLDVVFPKESISELSEMETNDDERHQSENEDSGSDTEGEFKEDSTLVVLRNGIKIKRRKTPRVIRYVRYSLKTNPENYYREKLMLFTPWRNECSDLLCGQQSFEQSFNQKKFFLAQKIKQYEHNADVLEQAEQMAQDDLTEAYDELAPGAQQTDADDEYEGNVDSETFVHFNPERPIEQREYDIGNEVGIPSTRQLNEQSSVRLPDDEYLKLVASLNLKQREFFNHVMQWIKSKQEPIHAYLSGGAGVGKSVLIKALYQALHRYLCAKEGENPDDIRILLCAYTGKAAFNIGGQTIASAFHQKINQRQQNMHCDELNTFRTKYRNLSVVIIDEISMAGNAKLEFINGRLQLLTGLKRPFGGISIIAVGDFFQLKPIMDGWIFQDLKQNAQALACNLWKENFTLFELDEVMRQKDDLEFAQLLNRLRHNEMTSEDLDIIHRCIIAENSPNYPHNAPHLFTMNAKVDEYNNKLIEQLPGEKVIVKAVDSVLQDHSKSVKDRLLRSLQNQDDVSKTANLMTKLTLAIGMIYDITVNIDVTDGLTNGSSCTVFLVENRLPGVSRPSIVWVKFLDSAVGRIARQKYRHLFHDGVMDDWTPIFDCQRSFVFNSTTYQRIQFPLRPAAGKTIHKAQGCTVDEIVVDLSQSRIRKTPHIHYVALSRVRSVDKLHILNFNEQALTVDDKVVEEMERMRKEAPLKLCYLPLYKTEQNKLKIMFNNARSLHKHFDEIKNEPNVVASDVIGFSETRLTINDEQNFMME